MADKTVIVEIQYDTTEAVKSIEKLTEVVEGEKVAQAKLKHELEKGQISQKDYAIAVEQSKQTQSKANTERKNTMNLLAAEKGSINELKAAIKKLESEQGNINRTTVKGNKQYKENAAKLGEMKKALKEAQSETGRTSGAFGTLGKNLSSIPGPIGGVVSGIGGMTKAALAFIATPLGAVLAAIVAAFGLLKKAFTGTEENQNKLNKGTAILKGMFDALLKVLRPLAEFLVNSLGKALEFVGKAVDKTLGGISKALKWLGFDKAAESVQNFKEKIEETTEASIELADAQAKLQKMQREARLIQLQYQKDAEKLRQIRDDESRSIDERIAANIRLGKVLKEQMSAELAIANQALAVVNMRIAQEGESTELLDARAEALTNIADIQERITGQESEQLTNTNALLKEKNDMIQKRLDLSKAEDEAIAASLKNQDDQIEANIDAELKAIDARLKLSDKETEELQKDLKERYDNLVKEQEAELEKVKAIEGAKAKLTEEFIKAGVQIATDQFNAKVDSELNSFKESQAAQETILKNRLDKGEISEKEYAKQLKALQLKTRQEEAKAQRKKDLFSIGLNTLVAVSKAVAESPVTFGLPFSAFALTQGAILSAAVLARPIPTFAKGGVIGGLSHAQGGTKFIGSDGSLFEAERGEAMFILKKDATAEIAALSQINESHGGRSFFSGGASHLANGGEVAAVDIAGQVSEAMQRTPIVVKVADISTGLTDVSKVKSVGVI